MRLLLSIALTILSICSCSVMVGDTAPGKGSISGGTLVDNTIAEVRLLNRIATTIDEHTVQLFLTSKLDSSISEISLNNDGTFLFQNLKFESYTVLIKSNTTGGLYSNITLNADNPNHTIDKLKLYPIKQITLDTRGVPVTHIELFDQFMTPKDSTITLSIIDYPKEEQTLPEHTQTLSVTTGTNDNNRFTTNVTQYSDTDYLGTIINYPDWEPPLTTVEPEINGDTTTYNGQSLFPGAQDYSFGITIKNNCEFPLWIHMTGKNSVDAPINIHNGKALLLKRKSRMEIDSVPQLRGGRIYGIYKDPGDTANFGKAISGYNSLVEMTFDTRLNFNISYVDNIALPVSVTGNNSDCQTTQCTLPNTPRFLNAVRELCPTELENEHQVGCYTLASCMSSYDFCNKNTNYLDSSYCTDIRDAYGDDPRLIFGMSYIEGDTEAQKEQAVAWNRGVEIGERRSWLYYPKDHPTPINEYAAMIHKDMGCTAYAFALDDHSGDGGMSFCETSKELVVTWCPREELEEGEAIDAQGSAQCPLYEDNWIIP